MFALLILAALSLTISARAATTITSAATTWTSGEYRLAGNVTISSRVNVTGNVTLNLVSGTLSVPKGIRVSEGNSLTINGTSGKLVIDDCESRQAGIGGDDGNACGTIVINGGSVNVTGGYGAAGIGNGPDALSGGALRKRRYVA